MTSRPSAAAPILAVLAVVLVVLSAMYVGAYFWLGDAFAVGTIYVEREFPHQRQQRAFQPVAWFEERLSGANVELTSPDDDSWHSVNRYMKQRQLPQRR